MMTNPSANANGLLRGYDYNCSKDKKLIFENYCDYMFVRTQSMFVYDGLPDTIPAVWLEQYLQRNGSCAIAKVHGKYYALLGSAGGGYDEYYQPTLYTVANPALNISNTYIIGKDCVYARNDYLAKGLTPLVSRYCGMLSENLITMRVADINMRMMAVLSASDDTTLMSTKMYLKDLEEGKIGAIGEGAFFDGLKLQASPATNSNYLTQFIELHQYLKGSLYNELGLNANFNMKRESIVESEAALNDDALMPLIDDMLKQRRKMCEDLSDLFGLNVKVDYGSTWHSNVIEKEFVGQTELGASSQLAEDMTDESRISSNNITEGVDIDGGKESRTETETESDQTTEAGNENSDDESAEAGEENKTDNEINEEEDDDESTKD